MKNCIKTAMIIFMVLTTAFALSVPGYGQKKNKGKKSDEKSSDGLKLEYNFPADKPLSYSSSTTIEMNMDIEGATMQVNIAMILACTVKSAGKEKENLKLGVTIDTLSQKIESPQGSDGGLVEGVAGKSFTMVLAPNGKAVDVTDAEKLTYMLQGSETNASQSFFNYFPVLPVRSLKPGDTWTSNDTIVTKATSMSNKQIVQADNKYEGVVTLDGIECAKITAMLKGTREQKGESMGMDVETKGDFTGTSELYFAVKEGYLIMETVKSKLTGNTELTGAQNMSIPVTQNTISVIKLKK
jgi:hypothetical protein